ncbi:MAG: alpha/beta fold hydrolase [Caldilineaceae bacterium]|nr:alpha/beta fold hydrolase [Caldilineaceae bacterium]
MKNSIYPTSISMKGHQGTLAALFLTALCIITLLPGTLHAQTAQACAQDVIVQSGDTLSTIAARTLNSQGSYQRIVDATNARAAVDSSYARITNANTITVGWKLCIPAGGTIAQPLLSAEGVAETYLVDNRTVDGAIGELPSISQRSDPDGIHPLTVAYLRKQSYAGSPLTVEQTLAPGSSFSRALVSYRSEGLKIYALLMTPFGQRPATGWPVVIFNHGYIPPDEYRTTERYESYMEGFAANGYLVLRPDLRGHGDSEGNANGAYGHPDYTIDVLNAVASVKQHPDADPDRIGMWGHSMGGYLTLRAMIVSREIKAGVIWSGVVASYEDLLQIWAVGAGIGLLPESAQRWGAEVLAEYGTPEENPLFWRSISSNSYVSDLSGPIQLHHGGGDLVVPPAFSSFLQADILEAGGEVEYYTYPGDDHSLSTNFTLAMGRSLAFFDAQVKHVPQP